MALRNISPIIVIFFLLIRQDPLLATVLELRQTGTTASDISVLVGDEIQVELWVDSGSQPLSGAAVFLSFDERVFELAGGDRMPGEAGYQPFARGEFLRNGEVFRNSLLDPSDPAAALAGSQLDYSVVRATDQGRGTAAFFTLRAKSPTTNGLIRIDESGIRETRFFTPNGSHQPFRFITPLNVTVEGISIDGLPSELVLARGQVDSTTFKFDDVVFDPLYGPRSIEWSLSPVGRVTLERDFETNILILSAPESESGWERLTLTATNPDGQSVSTFVDIYVNAAPDLPDQLDDVALEEDGVFELSLDDVVDDPDTPTHELAWTATASSHLSIAVEGPPYVARIRPAQNWSGDGLISLVATDEFGFMDSTVVQVSVAPVNDPPLLLMAPNLRIIRGRQDSSLVLRDLLFDQEDAVTDLRLSWGGEENVSLELRGDRLFVATPMDWQGTETIQLQVEDSQGLTSTSLLTVSVVTSLAPVIEDPPARLGLSGGEVSVLDLQQLVVDPDDQSADLRWTVSGQALVEVQLSTSGAARIEAPADFSDVETLTFTVTDPTGESAAFQLLIFAASQAGEPFIAPIPTLEVPQGGVDASIDLDDFILDTDHAPEEMEWFMPAVDGVDLRVDPITHVLSVSVSDSAAVSSWALELRVVDPDGHESTQSWWLHIIGTDGNDPITAPTAPTLAPFPSLTIMAGEFDQSIVLDEYVDGVDAASLSWEISGNEHTQVFVDPASRTLTVLADADWSGSEVLVIRATDLAGNAIEGLVGVEIIAAELEFTLPELTEISAFAGDTFIELDANALLNGANAAELIWEAQGSQPIAVTYNPDTQRLILTAAGFHEGTEEITLVARDETREVSGRIVARAHPADGSHGVEIPELRVAVVPNAIQPDYLDIFVVSDIELSRSPRLRARESDWSDLTVSSTTPGIWHGSYVLKPGVEGAVGLLALTMDAQQEALKATLDLSVGTALPSSAKRVSAASASVGFDSYAFSREAVVAIIPTPVSTTGPELTAVNGGFAVHSSQSYEGSGYITVDVAADAARSRLGLYRWDGAKSRWIYIEGDLSGHSLRAPLERLGRFAVLLDATPPRFEGLGTESGELHLRWRDDGSGLGAATVWVDAERELPASSHWWEGNLLVVDIGGLSTGDRRIKARVADKAGNTTVVDQLISVSAAVAPGRFALHQNYPNPFNPSTIIPFTVAAEHRSHVRLDVFNMAGQHVRQLLTADLAPGRHELVWDGLDRSGRQVSSGVYLYRIETAGMMQVRRMTLQR